MEIYARDIRFISVIIYILSYSVFFLLLGVYRMVAEGMYAYMYNKRKRYYNILTLRFVDERCGKYFHVVNTATIFAVREK